MTIWMDFPCSFILFSTCCRPVALVRGVLFVCAVCVWRCACLLPLVAASNDQTRRAGGLRAVRWLAARPCSSCKLVACGPASGPLAAGLRPNTSSWTRAGDSNPCGPSSPASGGVAGWLAN
jgi:hypothetical protein